MQAQIAALSSSEFQIGRVFVLNRGDVLEGHYEDLDIKFSGDNLDAAGPTVPPEHRGQWAAWNRVGQEVKRPDLPKRLKSWTTDVHPYGDRSRPTVPAYHSREVQATEVRHGKGFAFTYTAKPGGGEYGVQIEVRVDRVFSKATPVDSPDLLMAVRLLNECFGGVGVVAADQTEVRWRRDRELPWELLPPGVSPAAILRAIEARLGIISASRNTDVAIERIKNMQALNPPEIGVGGGGYQSYLAYIFRDDLVVLENFAYGNALYVMYESWDVLSKRSRIDLLSDPSADFTRIVHSGNWRGHLREVIRRSQWRGRR
ncbi:hypothetical protein [Isoptericola sp. NPDC057391]|uniref:hypothetical protein n=1 Tax=Isoptericola sp. NPDC057391 TaxID=3346117 RepID=UPI0036286CB0